MWQKIIDILTGQRECRAGSGLEGHTQEANAIRITNHPVHKDRIVLLDTPGFDDTAKSDLEVLQIIADWLVESYKIGVHLAGILYLHRITDNRMAGSPYRNLKMFGDLCGNKAARGVVLVTTMWDKLKTKEIGESREADLKKNFWADLIASQASVDRFENTLESARGIIDRLIVDRKEGVTLLLQEEIVDLERTLKETKAGQALYRDLQLLLCKQRGILRDLARHAKTQNDPQQAAQINEKFDLVQNEMEQLVGEIKNMQISIGRKIFLFFAKGSTAVRAPFVCLFLCLMNISSIASLEYYMTHLVGVICRVPIPKTILDLYRLTVTP
ncbi:hypothetical protein CPB84DRAFT_1939392 [Gymnopilus junonius]|uniref:G domain-containing protein n=1 Tax=Gymnopilus junonius TaxID=109634 RepID=A0A9P5NLN1_GYMJU|nr:hypothetical protein CPB84DRAFT_1939392 [Gymnopilus junonius]